MKLGKINKLSIVNNTYASVLRHIDQPPNQLFVIGELPPERRPTVAIVGSRRPTPYGIEVTHRLAYELAKSGVVIVSGLALGIDSVAHKAALEAGGTTIAVLAGGLHRIYPSSHLGLARDIINKGGAVISEQSEGVEAMKHHFLARNRLVSGLADAVIVTEATSRSGTLSTVSHALAQNKDVFAVPGPINSLLSVGPNRLIQQGAQVVLEAKDILDIIAPRLKTSQRQLPLGDTPLEAQIIKYISEGVKDGEKLLELCVANLGAGTGEFQETLTMMELKGMIRSHGANTWGLG